MVLEEQLLAYGPLGLWTFTLLYEKFKMHAKLIDVLEKNNEMLARVDENIPAKRAARS